MIDKVLVFGRYSANKNVGGPMGFFAQNLSGHKGQYFDTAEYLLTPPRWFTRLRKYLSPKLFSYEWLVSNDLKVAKVPRQMPNYDWLVETIVAFKYTNARDYRVLFFHDLFTYSVVKHLIGPGQTVVFQPHSPELISNETVYITQDPLCIAWVKAIEAEAFREIKHFVFPNDEASVIYESLLQQDIQKHFILSACQAKVHTAEEQLDEQYINLGYIGRRTAIKGFDLLLDAFREAQAIRPALRLYILGNGEKVSGEGIIDVGFTTTPENWMASFDYLVNVNRQSYFDLILMEALSIGTPILLYPGQGHVYFEQHPTKGIHLVPSLTKDALKEALLNPALNKKTPEMVAANQQAYHESFTPEHYRQRLDSFSALIIKQTKDGIRNRSQL